MMVIVHAKFELQLSGGQACQINVKFVEKGLRPAIW